MDDYTLNIKKPACSQSNTVCNGLGITPNTKQAWFNDSARALKWSGKFELYNSMMSLEGCKAAALSLGKNIYGLEFGQE
jgi:hypothetical protein